MNNFYSPIQNDPLTTSPYYQGDKFGTAGGPVAPSFLAQENGFLILQEDLSRIIVT